MKSSFKKLYKRLDEIEELLKESIKSEEAKDLMSEVRKQILGMNVDLNTSNNL